MSQTQELAQFPNTTRGPNYRLRRGIALTALSASIAVAYVSFNKLADRIGGTGPEQTSVPAHVGDRLYTVKANDTLTGIVNRAHPEYAPYSEEFKQAVSRLDRQLPAEDQFRGTVHPGEKLVLDDGSNIGQPQR